MWLEVFRAVSGLLILMLVWFGIQTLVRRSKKAPASTDVLDHVKHGCGGCPQEDSCASHHPADLASQTAHRSGFVKKRTAP